MVLKLYVDHNSQPCRAILLFCRINNIDYEEHSVAFPTGELFTFKNVDLKSPQQQNNLNM